MGSDMSAIEITRGVPTRLTPHPTRSTADRTGDGRSGEPVLRRTDVLPLLVYVAFATALGWCVGQDANWDSHNYHWYNVFIWLSDRFERDVHVAGVQRFSIQCSTSLVFCGDQVRPTADVVRAGPLGSSWRPAVLRASGHHLALAFDGSYWQAPAAASWLQLHRRMAPPFTPRSARRWKTPPLACRYLAHSPC